MPKQLVIVTQLLIPFAANNFLMFLQSDRPLLLKLDFRPLLSAKNRPRQPCHTQRVIVEPPQKDVRANRSVFQCPQEMFWARFQEWHVPQTVKRFVFHRALPTILGRTTPELVHFVHNKLPRPFGNFRVACSQIGASDLQIQYGLSEGFVFGMKQCGCFVFVSRA